MFALASILDLVLTLFIIERIIITETKSFDSLTTKTTDFVETYKSPWIYYSLTCVFFVLSILGSLVFSLSLLNVVAAWTKSMRDAGRPYYGKLNRALSSVRTFKVLYIILGFGQILCLTLATFLSIIALFPLILIDLIHCVCNLWMLVVTIWMVIDLIKPINDSIRMKRNQLIRIILLILFQATVTFNYDAEYMQLFSAALWLVECFILMWPRTLIDLGLSPLNAYPIKNAHIGKV